MWSAQGTIKILLKSDFSSDLIHFIAIIGVRATPPSGEILNTLNLRICSLLKIIGFLFSPNLLNKWIFDVRTRAKQSLLRRSWLIRGVFKKFAAQPRRKTNFTTKRGVRDVTLLKRPLTQPLANRSSCFAQAVGCCKNVCYFCRTQRRSAGSSDSIRSVTEKRRKGYPWILVGNTGGTLSFLQECQSEDWALQS